MTLMATEKTQVRAGDLVEATTASTRPRTIRVRVDREPWPVNDRATSLSDGKGVVAVLTDSMRVVETSSIAPPVVDGAPRETGRQGQADGPRKVQFLGDSRDNEAHIEDLDNLTVALCGVGLWENNRLDGPMGRTLCKLCGEMSYDESYEQDLVRKFFPSQVGGSW